MCDQRREFIKSAFSEYNRDIRVDKYTKSSKFPFGGNHSNFDVIGNT